MKFLSFKLAFCFFMAVQLIMAQEHAYILYDSDSLLNEVLLRKGSGPQDCGWVQTILMVDLSCISKLSSANITKECYTDILRNFKGTYGYFNPEKPEKMIPVRGTIKGFRELLTNATLVGEYLLKPLQISPGCSVDGSLFIIKNDTRAYFEVTSANWLTGYVATLIGDHTIRIDRIFDEEWIPVPDVPASEDAPDTFMVVEEFPKFRGGAGAMNEWIKSNLERSGIVLSRKVFIGFIVETNGQLTGFRVLRGDTPETDSAVINLLRTMPAWKPGKHEGKEVRVMYNLKVE
jgi:hypothetical protein